MTLDIEQYIKTCGSCITRKTLPQKSDPLSHITSNGPLDLVCIDFLSLEPDTKGIANVLVITDHFTCYAQAFPTKDQRAVTVAKVLVEKLFVHYGLPSRIHSDQGRDFECRLIRELLGMLGIQKSRTTPYHPQGDPQPERFNRTLLSMLGTLDPANKSKWSQYIPQLVHAYNCTKNEATGYSPYHLLFGREARLPIDVCFVTSSDNQRGVDHLQYIEIMKKDLQQAYQLATETSLKVYQQKQKPPVTRAQTVKRRQRKQNKDSVDQVVEAKKFRRVRMMISAIIAPQGSATKGRHHLHVPWNLKLYLLQVTQSLPRSVQGERIRQKMIPERSLICFRKLRRI